VLPEPTQGEIADDHSLILLANAGPRFWTWVEADDASAHSADPVDTVSVQLAMELNKHYFESDNFIQLYPTPKNQAHIPLMRSRLVPATDYITERHALGNLCLDCSAPCVDACPAQAVHTEQSFNVQACYEYRKPESSQCHSHCAARRACPIGKQHQYSQAQMAHHMNMTWRR